ncbi:MAG: osmotically-inducible protein OsmY [Paraglaciecola sp.]
MTNSKINKIALLLGIVLVMQGCAALVVGAGVGVVSAAHDRRSLGTQVDDKTAYSRLATALGKSAVIKEQTNINVHVYNGSALLVGQAPTEDLLRQVQQVAESVKNIKKLHNQVRIGSPISTATTTNDLWLASKVKTKLLADKRIDGLHIDVAVENSEVFLMGIVSQSEADISVDIARNVSGVTQVIKAFEYL